MYLLLLFFNLSIYHFSIYISLFSVYHITLSIYPFSLSIFLVSFFSFSSSSNLSIYLFFYIISFSISVLYLFITFLYLSIFVALWNTKSQPPVCSCHMPLNSRSPANCFPPPSPQSFHHVVLGLPTPCFPSLTQVNVPFPLFP